MSPLTAQAKSALAAFQERKDPEDLKDAGDLLEGVVLADEPDAEQRRALRKETLELWLELFAAIDGSLDPSFDPKDVPLLGVQPPPSQGVVFPPGVDPSLLQDPAARREYEQRLAENQRKAESYSLQLKLRRLDTRLTPRLERFVRTAYSTATEPEERREVLSAIEAIITDPARAEALRKLV